MRSWKEVFPITNLTMKDIDDWAYNDAFGDAPSWWLEALRERIEEIMEFKKILERR